MGMVASMWHNVVMKAVWWRAWSRVARATHPTSSSSTLPSYYYLARFPELPLFLRVCSVNNTTFLFFDGAKYLRKNLSYTASKSLLNRPNTLILCLGAFPAG